MFQTISRILGNIWVNFGFLFLELLGAWFRLKDIPPIDVMEKQYCKRCNATKPVEEFNGINRYCIRCLEKDREKHQRKKNKDISKAKNTMKNIRKK